MSHYNKELIDKVLFDFKQEMLTYSGERVLLFDADNTLYLFSIHGKEDDALTQHLNKGYYHNLPIFMEAPDVVRNLQKFGIRVGICTKYPTENIKAEKLESFKYHFPTIREEDMIFVPQDDNKFDYIKDVKHTILVDDYHGNITSYYEAGGVAIKKSYSGKERPVPVVTSLIDLFPLLHSLNFI